MDPKQEYENYSQEDHATWSTLFERQSKTILKIASSEFVKGFNLLSLDPHHVANLGTVNKMLKDVTGWRVIPASGLVSNKDFFSLLRDKKFPVTVSMRKPEEIAFSELPDIFHDVYGHVPMLMNRMFCEFMSAYSGLAIDFSEDEGITACFGRLYWFTLEMGLIREDNVIRPFGGAILTSSGEVDNINNPDVPKHPFNLLQVINTPYDNLQLQKEYFFIDSFHQLFDSLKDLKVYLDKQRIVHI